MAALLSFKTAKKFGLDKHKYTSAEKGMCYLLSAATVLSTIALLSIMRVSTLIYHMTGAMYDKPMNWVIVNVPAILAFILFVVLAGAYYMLGRIRYRNLCTILFFLSVLVGLFCATLLSFGTVAITGVMYIQLPDGTTGGIDAMLAYLSMYWGAAKLHYGIMAVMAIISALFLLLIKILGGYEEDETSGNYGTAQMADTQYLRKEGDIIKTRFPKRQAKQIIYGKLNNQYIGSSDVKSRLVVAPPRQGKSTTVSIPFMLDCPYNVLCFDNKGEIFLTTYNQRMALGKFPVAIDIFGVLNEHGKFNKFIADGFDLLGGHFKDEFERERYISALCKALVVKKDGHSSSDHFIDAAYAIIHGILDAFVGSSYSMKHVYDNYIVKAGEDLIATLEEMNKDMKSRSLATALAYLQKAGSKERGSMETTIMRCFRFMTNEPCANFFSQGSFSMNDFIYGNSDIFIVMPSDMMSDEGYGHLIVRLIIAIANTALIRAEKKRMHKRYPFLLDEIAQLKYFPLVEEMIENGGNLGIRVIAAFQTLKQIKIYKKHDLFEGMDVKQFFRVNDLETVKWIRGLSGTRTVKTESSSESVNQKGKFVSSPDRKGFSTSEQEAGVALIHDDQILTMPWNEQLVFLSGKRPIKCERVNYLTDSRYIGKHENNPVDKG